ncbi:MAG: type II toxin-antitoxin system HicA family toxin [Lachnospiraceae bacterium]|nr:type II toxin-antitoxin system HicA family toxin [Lachnospiraceae bacterium]
MKHRDLIKRIEAAGGTLQRAGSRHDIYIMPDGKSIPVPRHREIKETTAAEILKDAGV